MKPALVSQMKSAGVLLALGCFAAGCDKSPTGPSELPAGLEIRATATVFNVQTVNGRKTAIVTTSLVNNGHNTILVNYCGARLFESTGGSWAEIWAQNCAAVNGVYTELKPGGAASFGATLSDSGTGTLGPAFTFKPGAIYSLSVPLLLKTGDGSSDINFVRPSETRSTAFTFAL